MRKIRMKWNNNRGETRVESLAAILLIALSTSVFLSFTMNSGKLMEKRRREEKEFYAAMSFLERMDEEPAAERDSRTVSSGTLTVTIESETGVKRSRETFPVRVYEMDGMTSYQLETSKKGGSGEDVAP